MKLKNITMAVAAMGLVAAPVAAESLRDAAPVSATSELNGQSDIFIILGVLAAVVGAIALASDGDDPVSA